MRADPAGKGRHVKFEEPTHATAADHRIDFSPSGADLDAHVADPVHITVPLSRVPPEVLDVGTQPDKAEQLSSNSSSAASAAASTAVSGRTARFSQLLQAEKHKANEVGLRINRPRQVTGLPTKYHKALAWTGRVGWVGKAVVYAMIGGLACQSAVGNDRPDPRLAQTEQISASPQCAFVLLGTTPGGVSIVILLIMMVALLAYITWRFWEGLAGQGYDDTFSAKKNFFKFRVSPIVSGAVYVSYLVFLITLLDREVRHLPSQPGTPKEGWPATWRHSAGGRVGLALLGIAFCIATCIQLQGVLTRQWHKDYRNDLPKPLMTAVFTIGHFGFAGRAGAFLAMAILFFKDAGGSEDAPHNSSMVANALQQLQGNRGLRAVLMIIGLLLILYGLFATLSACTRMFPTPPPSRRKRLPAAEYKRHKQQHPDQHSPHHHQHLTADQQGQQQQVQATNRCLPWRKQQQPLKSPTTTVRSTLSATNSHSPAGGSLALTAVAGSEVAAAPPDTHHTVSDESPYWGRDQGLSRMSPVQEGAAAAAGPSVGSAPSRPRHMFVLPSHRSREAAGVGGQADAAAGSRGSSVGPVREFVTIDL